MATAPTPTSIAPSASEPTPLSRPETRPAWFLLDRHLGLALLLAAAVVIPRSYLIARSHSESCDDDYHLTRGLAFLTRGIARADLDLNDPPLGEGLIAVPMLITNRIEGRPATDDRLYDVPERAETIAVRTAVWNSVLFVAFLGVVFSWCRSLYGVRSAWFAVALFVVEPSFAAHVPIPALDVVGVEGIVLGCFLAWRYFERPTTGRLIALGVGTAFALMLKHTAVVLPPVVLALAGLHWVVRPWLDRQDWAAWKGALTGRLRALAWLGIIVPTSIWALTLFDFSPPMTRAVAERWNDVREGAPVSQGKSLRVALERKLGFDTPWPAGCYVRAFRSGMGHGMVGHWAYLNGERRDHGWWYYFPVVATYKVPIGIGVVLLVALLSLRSTPPRWPEWGPFVPMLAWTLFLLNSKVNIGFRHFLPAYAFMLMLSSRCVVRPGRGWVTLGWAGIAAAGIHALSYHPDYLSYLNAPRTKPYLEISDSNLDWGQSLKQVRDWLDAHPQGERAVSLSYFGKDNQSVLYYLGDRVVPLDMYALRRPTTGLLLISPVRLAGVYEDSDPFAALRPFEPDAVIGHSMLVFDLDRLGGDASFRWPPGEPRE